MARSFSPRRVRIMARPAIAIVGDYALAFALAFCGVAMVALGLHGFDLASDPLTYLDVHGMTDRDLARIMLLTVVAGIGSVLVATIMAFNVPTTMEY